VSLDVESHSDEELRYETSMQQGQCHEHWHDGSSSHHASTMPPGFSSSAGLGSFAVTVAPLPTGRVVAMPCQPHCGYLPVVTAQNSGMSLVLSPPPSAQASAGPTSPFSAMFVNDHFATVVGAGVEQSTHSMVTSSVLPRISSQSEAFLEGSFGAAAGAWDNVSPVNPMGMISASFGAAAGVRFTDPVGMVLDTSQQSEGLFIGFGASTRASVKGSPAYRTATSSATPWTSTQNEDLFLSSIGAAAVAATPGPSASLAAVTSAELVGSIDSGLRTASVVGGASWIPLLNLAEVLTRDPMLVHPTCLTAAVGASSSVSRQNLAEVLMNAMPDHYED